MARLNAKRRRALALEKARHEFALVLNPSMVASEGHVRSSHKAKVANQMIPSVARAYSPKPLNFDSEGVKGRVQRGKVVPPKRPDRWGTK